MTYIPTNDDLLKHKIVELLSQTNGSYRRSTLASKIETYADNVDYLTQQMLADKALVKHESAMDEFYVTRSPMTVGLYERKFYLTDRNPHQSTIPNITMTGKNKLSIGSTLTDSMNNGSTKEDILTKWIKYLVKKWWAWAIVIIVSAAIIYVRSHIPAKRTSTLIEQGKVEKTKFST